MQSLRMSDSLEQTDYYVATLFLDLESHSGCNVPQSIGSPLRGSYVWAWMQTAGLAWQTVQSHRKANFKCMYFNIHAYYDAKLVQQKDFQLRAS